MFHGRRLLKLVPQRAWSATSVGGISQCRTEAKLHPYPRKQNSSVEGVPMPPKEYEIVDPLALILSPYIYQIIHLPDPPPDLRTKVQESVREMSAKDRQQALARLKILAAYANAVV